jgi:hypothetical protein
MPRYAQLAILELKLLQPLYLFDLQSTKFLAPARSRGTLRCVERCCPSAAQARRSETCNCADLLNASAATRGGLKASPGSLLKNELVQRQIRDRFATFDHIDCLEPTGDADRQELQRASSRRTPPHHSENTGKRWVMAEVLRTKASYLLPIGWGNWREIENILLDSLATAKRQQARCWERRTSFTMSARFCGA